MTTKFVDILEAQTDRDVRELESKAAIWRKASHDLKAAEQAEKEARQQLIDAADSETFEGFGVKVDKLTRKGAIEYRAIPELSEVNLEKYRKGGSAYWTVRASVKE